MVDRIILYDYSKAIFYYPLFFFSVFALIFEAVHDVMRPTDPPVSWLSVVWMAIFFANMFVTAFDFSTGKFLMLILGITVIVLIIIILTITGTIQWPAIDYNAVMAFNINLTTTFYGIMVGILGFILLCVILSARFKFVKIETNEIQVHGFWGSVVRYAVSELVNYKVDHPDIFERIALRSGSIRFMFKNGEDLLLETVVNCEKKKIMLDKLLSTTKVSTK